MIRLLRFREIVVFLLAFLLFFYFESQQPFGSGIFAPDAALCMTVLISSFHGAYYGIAAGLISGFTRDWLHGGLFGPAMLCGLFAALILSRPLKEDSRYKFVAPYWRAGLLAFCYEFFPPLLLLLLPFSRQNEAGLWLRLSLPMRRALGGMPANALLLSFLILLFYFLLPPRKKSRKSESIILSQDSTKVLS